MNLLKISLKFVPKVQINNIPALVQIMTWHREGDKPLSEPMMVSILMHICVTRPQWVKYIMLSWEAFSSIVLPQVSSVYDYLRGLTKDDIGNPNMHQSWGISYVWLFNLSCMFANDIQNYDIQICIWYLYFLLIKCTNIIKRNIFRHRNMIINFRISTYSSRFILVMIRAL